MITKEQAIHLDLGQTLYHATYKNANGSPLRWRVNGQTKTWKTRPDEFRVPIKHGLWDYDYLTHDNAHMLFINEHDVTEED